MARLIRTEKEVEGRYEEVWTVVEEDALDQWPAGPLEVVGQPAPRQDGLQRARGEARYTADVHLPGMLHAAVLRSPVARAVARTLDLSPALELPGVHAALSYEEVDFLDAEIGFPGAAVAAQNSADSEFRSGVAAWAAASVTTAAIWAIICIAAGEFAHPWFLWVAGPWGTVLLVSWLGMRLQGR